MSTEPKERWRELCEEAVGEQDPERFLATILKLIQTLEGETTARYDAATGPIQRRIYTLSRSEA